MGSAWIVDANNVIGSRPDGWWRDRPRALQRLLDEIIRWQVEVGDPVTVVADGHPTSWVPEGTRAGVTVVYAHSNAPDAADDVMVELVARADEPADLTVVSSDRDLGRRAEAHGARREGARSFLGRIADIEVRRSDRAVLAHFGLDESALLGRGGEARVFAIDDERVLRLPHRGVPRAHLDHRRALLDAIATDDFVVALPRVLDHVDVAGRTVVIERRLPGTDALARLGHPHADRAGLVRDHLSVARRLADLPAPMVGFGEVWGEGAQTARTFSEWATAKLAASLARAGADFAGISAQALTDAVAAALPDPDPLEPRLVHLDAFLGNMLATDDRISAVLDFGPMTIGGPADLDPLVAIAYLAPEITPTATDQDRGEATAWATEVGIADAIVPVRRWIAAYWSGAVDDLGLQRFCRRVLLHDP